MIRFKIGLLEGWADALPYRARSDLHPDAKRLCRLGIGCGLPRYIRTEATPLPPLASLPRGGAFGRRPFSCGRSVMEAFLVSTLSVALRRVGGRMAARPPEHGASALLLRRVRRQDAVRDAD